MSSAGRGRGRGRGVMNAPPAKPGGGASKDPMDQLSTLVKSLSMDADEKELLPIKETALKAGTSKEKLEDILKMLIQRCQEDWRCSPTSAKICCDLEATGIEVEGGKFRSILLQLVQNEFKNKDKLREESPQKFLGTISLLCQLFGQMRDASGDPLKPLSASVMESLEMILDDKASDEEMICAAEQLYSTGRLLQKLVEKMRMTSLRNKVKDKVIHAVGSRDTRRELLKVVEGFASDWKKYT